MTRRPVNLSLYLVTDTGLCGPRGVPATVQAAVAGGVTVVQLRDPGATDAHFVALGVAVREVLAGTGVQFDLAGRRDFVGRRVLRDLRTCSGHEFSRGAVRKSRAACAHGDC